VVLPSYLCLVKFLQLAVSATPSALANRLIPSRSEPTAWKTPTTGDQQLGKDCAAVGGSAWVGPPTSPALRTVPTSFGLVYFWTISTLNFLSSPVRSTTFTAPLLARFLGRLAYTRIGSRHEIVARESTFANWSVQYTNLRTIRLLSLILLRRMKEIVDKAARMMVQRLYLFRGLVRGRTNLQG
jgi:hypothetical protein